MLDITVIILTYNEELHICRCIENVKGIAKEIFLVDSFSTDGTVEIARSLGAVVYQNRWENNHSKQFNWGLDNLPITSKWVLRLDADEYLTAELIEELNDKLQQLSEDVTGVVFPLRRIFMGRQMHHGLGTVKLLRLFRVGVGRSEVRLMDEHIQLTCGKTVEFTHPFVDDNLNNLSWWTIKHVGYAIREAVDLINIELDLTGAASSDHNKLLGEQAQAKRAKKHRYAKSPLFLRSFLYFCYRYFFKLGFLDGKEGFLWHFMQGWWYRTLVDAKVFEIYQACGKDKERIRVYLKAKYKMEL